MQCWNCKTSIVDPPYGKISFRETCEKCGTDLHCCQNCKFYKPGQPNDCLVPGTSFIADRKVNNFCEEFKITSKVTEEKKDTHIKKRFDDLFK